MSILASNPAFAWPIRFVYSTGKRNFGASNTIFIFFNDLHRICATAHSSAVKISDIALSRSTSTGEPPTHPEETEPRLAFPDVVSQTCVPAWDREKAPCAQFKFRPRGPSRRGGLFIHRFDSTLKPRQYFHCVANDGLCGAAASVALQS